MHNQELKNVLKERFTDAEAQEIIVFLEKGFSTNGGKGFCPNGEKVLVSLFLYAQGRGKKLVDILAVCREEWEENWRYQYPDARGDPNASVIIGRKNIISLNKIYRILDIPNLDEEGERLS